MITGAHSIIYSSNAEADMDFFRNILKFPHVDVGRGWLIFALPPSEIAVHPADSNDRYDFYLMCDDINAFIAEMAGHNITCGPIDTQRWGLVTNLTLPGGGKLGVYEPRHARPGV
jgi:hypothetical protein